MIVLFFADELDVCLYTVMSCARSLIVDTLPIEKQQAGAAWGE